MKIYIKPHGLPFCGMPPPTSWCALPVELPPLRLHPPSRHWSCIALYASVAFLVSWCGSHGAWLIVGVCYAGIVLLSSLVASGSYRRCRRPLFCSHYGGASRYGVPHPVGRRRAVFIMVGFHTVAFGFRRRAGALHLASHTFVSRQSQREFPGMSIP
jgi:hypothetical protein